MTEKEKLVNLILRSELEASNRGIFNCTPQNEYKAEIVADFLLQNGVSVIPIKHGRWTQVDKNKCECSNCGIVVLIAVYPHGNKNYCPNCGAKMDGEEE